MPKPIIVVASHASAMPNKILHKRLSSIMDSSICFLVDFKGFASSGDPLFSISLLISDSKLPLNLEQKLIQDNIHKIIEQKEKVLKDNLSVTDITTSNEPQSFEINFSMNEIVDIIFGIANKLNSEITGCLFNSCFRKQTAAKLYLFPDVNLADPGSDNITRHFHNAVHLFGDAFYKKYSDFAQYYVYGYSQSTTALDYATSYFNGDVVDNMQLQLHLEHSTAAQRIDIPKKALYCSENQKASNKYNESFQLTSLSCFGIFSFERVAKVGVLDANHTQVIEDKEESKTIESSSRRGTLLDESLIAKNTF